MADLEPGLCAFQGGRLTITPDSRKFELVFERLIMLLAGSSLEAAATALGGEDVDASAEGFVTGAVASRRMVSKAPTAWSVERSGLLALETRG